MNDNTTQASQNTTEAQFSVVADQIQQDIVRKPFVMPTQVQDDFHDFRKHRALLYSLSWDTTTTGNNILSTDIMSDFQSAISAGAGTLGQKLANFRAFTARIKITVVVQGYTFSCGKMLLWFDPAPFPMNSTTVPSNNIPSAGTMHAYPQKVRAHLLPRIVIDPSKSESHELELPCCTLSQFWSFVQPLGSYRAGALVVNQLGSGNSGTQPPVNIQIYMSLVDPKMSAVTFTSGFISKEQNSMSTSAQDISNGLSMMSNVPYIGPGATLMSNLSGKAATLLKWMGFSRPVVNEKQNMYLAYTCDEPAVMDGKLHAQTLANRHDNSITVDANSIPLCSYTDQQLEWVLNQYGLIQQFSIASTDAAESFKTEIPINPIYYFATDSPAITNGWEIPPITHVSYLFFHWRMDFKVRFEFIASSRHRCTALIAYNPNPLLVTGTPPTAADAILTLKTWQVQISGNTVLDLEIPYSQPEPFCDKISVRSDIPYKIGTGNGSLYVYVLNPNISGGTFPINCNVFIAGCNGKFGLPCSDGMSQFSYSFTSGAVAPSTLSNPVCNDEPRFYKDFFGEEAPHSFKELATRACHFFTTDPSTFTSSSNHIMQCSFQSDMTACNPEMTVARGFSKAPIDMLGWIAGGYVGYKGSMNFMSWLCGCDNNDYNFLEALVINRAEQTTQVGCFSVGDGDFLVQSVSNDRPFYSVYGRNQNCTNTKVPYFYKGYFRPMFPITNASSYGGDAQRAIRIAVQSNSPVFTGTSASTTLSVKRCAGDDGNFVWYRGMPVIISTG